MQKHYLLPVSLLLILLTSINMATCQDQGSGDPSGEDTNCAPGESLTMEGECQPTCNAGYTWCDAGQQCEVNSDGQGFICTCSPGFYEDRETQSCKAGRYFGGILYFDANSTLYSVRSLDESEALRIIEEIYGNSTYYYSSTVLPCAANECSYQLVYENAEGVNKAYIEDIFVNNTDNCKENFTKDFDCNKTRDTGFNQEVMCGTDGTFSNTCDDNTAACKVSNTGTFFCDCKSENYVLPYSDATSCTEIKCSRDEDCSGGGIHGSCRISDENYAENFCECKWGFTGNTCEDPWWFVFTVLTGAFGVIAIVILAACICMSTKKVPAKSGVQKDDLDLKNPFVDFQPGVRAKASTNLYSSVTDSISSPTTHGHSNPAFNNNAFDENDKATPYAATAQGNDYF